MKWLINKNLKFQESDTDQPQFPTTNTPQQQNPGSSALDKIITGASVGIGGVVTCLAYLYKTYGVTNKDQLSQYFKNAIAGDESTGWFGTFIKRIVSSIGGALTWANNLVKPLTAKIPGLSTQIAGSSFTYGSVMSMAIVAAAVGAVIYKVYKVIKNRKKQQETTEAFFVRQRFEMLTALNECDLMFRELTALTEWGFGDMFVSYSGVTGEAINQTVSGNTTELSKQLSKSINSGDGFIGKIWGSIQDLYKQAAEIAKQNPTLAKVVIIITALVACWFGIKKYLANKAKNAEKNQASNNQNASTPQNTNTQRNNNKVTTNKVNNTNTAPATA